jgi:MoaA/NifB/PqqE/SkfB family radical SAM enzyme
MKEIQYNKFSLAAHLSNLELKRPSYCQMELTYACGLHCPYCYAAGYNCAARIGKEMNTAQLKKTIDELKRLGVLWICFTGGDPLMRKDFCELYTYARNQGFLIIVFTGGYSLTKKHLDLFKRQPPYNIEITLNAVEEELYEKISGVRGSFKKVMAAIEALRRDKLPLKIKTMVTTLNLHHIAEIKKYLRGIGLKFYPDYFLHSGFDGDRRPLAFQIPLGAIPGRVNTKNNIYSCASQQRKVQPEHIFTCIVAAGDGFQIDPYGNIALCFSIREPKINILKRDLPLGLKQLIQYFSRLDFTTDSKCKSCVKRSECTWCPGKAFVETGSLEKPVDSCCELAGVCENQ